MDFNLDKTSIKEKLLTLKTELENLQAISHSTRKPVMLDQTTVGRLSRMDALQAQAMSHETQRRRGIQIQKIIGALQRIEKDEYGYCLKCDEAIDPKRLDFDLTAFLCIDCAKATEK